MIPDELGESTAKALQELSREFGERASNIRRTLLESIVDTLVCQDVDLKRMSIRRIPGDSRQGVYVDGTCVAVVDERFYDLGMPSGRLEFVMWWLPPYEHLPSLAPGDRGR